MRALAIIGSAVAGGTVGGIVGFWYGGKEGGDFNFGPAIFAPIGMTAGGFVGLVVGVLRWAR